MLWGSRWMDGETSQPSAVQEAPMRVQDRDCGRIWVPRDPPEALHFDEKLMIFKPSGWEVENPSGSSSLCAFLIRILGPRPIFQDARATFGFLHRLDVPSSGLILAACSYESYYDLRVQLANGDVLREYLVLCHGFGSALSVISSGVLWSDAGGRSRASGRGKPSRSVVKNWALGYLTTSSCSWAVVRIATGRRHQIRVHLAFEGRPSYGDAMYTTAATNEFDWHVCPRNMLHRHHLRFFDSDSRHSVIAPLPSDMVGVLSKIVPKDSASKERLQKLQSWKAEMLEELDLENEEFSE
ncbi:Ribosomal large subunit pseudouridine synthase D (23S rRNA pseudouridine(1911/1915/1917) synthase) (rRNA pseudouridylate synthase D) (rRNA-uridine isomerase D) [Durusdinium trenchii]|uniref:Ribosomal large subunit pseudouridine synthase D (23S rRNA pseudouridine(1911/1915/1917) synthase) (rRNA pseudouridylate synthase D) (rRNA-uridine isomerase D) n=1 Tax=Durusdinium trenchii TaxID=1381693 RepID=A0ABP0SND8_9DINO